MISFASIEIAIRDLIHIKIGWAIMINMQGSAEDRE